MPPKVKKPKAPKKKGLKQKQKQMVRTSVKVNVQSAGGSGAGGSIPPTAGVPSAFNEARLASLIEQIGRRVPVQQPVYVPSGMPIQEQVPVARFEPANDEATLKAVFMGESDLRKPLTNTGPAVPKARARRADESDESYGIRIAKYEQQLANKSKRERDKTAQRQYAELTSKFPEATAFTEEPSDVAFAKYTSE